MWAQDPPILVGPLRLVPSLHTTIGKVAWHRLR